MISFFHIFCQYCLVFLRICPWIFFIIFCQYCFLAQYEIPIMYSRLMKTFRAGKDEIWKGEKFWNEKWKHEHYYLSALKFRFCFKIASWFSHVLIHLVCVWRFLPCSICFDTASFMSLIFLCKFLALSLFFLQLLLFALFSRKNFSLVFHLSNFSSADFCSVPFVLTQHFWCFDSTFCYVLDSDFSLRFLQHSVCFDSARFLLVQPLSSCVSAIKALLN